MKKMFRASILFSALAFISTTTPASCVAQARTNPTTLRGTVSISASFAPPAFVRVRLEQFGMTIQEVHPRENRFEFRNVDDGHYTLVADAPGYETAHEEVNVPGDWPQLVLRAKREPLQRAEAVSVLDLKVPKAARQQFQAAKRELNQHNCQNAITHLKRAINTYVEYGDAHQTIAGCYAQLKDFESAEREYKRALEQPHAPELHLQLAKIYESANNPMLRARQLQLYAEENAKIQRPRQ
jgi:tetratricopeptide (TPR) repeat protein